MKHERTVRECTYQASNSAPPCVLLVDPDPLAAKRVSHNARWMWTDEEALFFALTVIETRIADLGASVRAQLDRETMAGMAATAKYLASIIDPEGSARQVVATKKRLTPKRKGA